MEQYEEMLGIGVVNIVNMFRPQLILLGGALSEHARRNDRFHPGNDGERLLRRSHGMIPEITVAELGSRAGMIGAANL